METLHTEGGNVTRMIGWTGRALTAVPAMVLLAAASAAGQEPGVEAFDLPRDVADEVVAYFNDPGVVRFDGDGRVPAGRRIVGNVAVLGGTFTVAGTVEGRLVVVNGDLRFEEAGRVDGDVTVIGGSVDGREAGSVGGTLTVYEEALRYVERDGTIAVREGRPDEARGGIPLWGQSRFTIRNGGSYNRVEGLPVLFGPVIQLGGRNPFRAEVLGLWRTESGFSLEDDELGWRLRLEQRLEGQPTLALGATLHSTTEPISDHGLSDLETSLSTFFLHKDYRDFYDRKGWSLYGRVGLDVGTPLDLTVEFRDEDHSFAPVSSPWTLRRNDEPWRPQPLVAEGDLQTVAAELVLDGRNDPERPSHGWFVRLGATHAIGGELAFPERAVADVILPPEPVDHDFTSAVLDARRYDRLGPDSEVSFRFLLGGAIDDRPLPPQFQHALGGEGSLPGYRLFSLDCGARATTAVIERSAFDEEEDATQEAFTGFGCDRAFLFQAEYRGTFGVDIDFDPRGEEWDEDWDWYPVIDLTPSWAAFVDVGRGWSVVDEAMDTDTFADVGVGFFIGDLGLYWAYPLNGDDRDVNFFVRLERRF